MDDTKEKLIRKSDGDPFKVRWSNKYHTKEEAIRKGVYVVRGVKVYENPVGPQPVGGSPEERRNRFVLIRGGI